VEFSLPLLMGRFDSLPTTLTIRSTARFQREKKATPLASTDAIVCGRMRHMAKRSKRVYSNGGLSGALSVLSAALICFALLGQLAGCNRSSQESQVSGVVTLDGKAVGPGSVAFAPVDKEKPATGPIDASGNYSMTTGHEVGLSAGKYKVALSIREVPQNVKRGDRPPPGKSLIPEKYEESASSGLEYDVAPGRNTINIELRSDASGPVRNKAEVNPGQLQ
jgi:hypothetical protein